MKKILVTVPLEERHINYLKKQAEGHTEQAELVIRKPEDVTDEDLAEADAIFGNPTAAELAKTNHLTWLQLHSAGAAQYSSPEVLSKDAVLTNAAGAYNLTVSEHMLAQTFALVRRFPEYSRKQAAHDWSCAGDVTSIEGSTVLILGMGGIGLRYGRNMKALGAHTVGVRRSLHDLPEGFDEQHTIAELDSLLGNADIIALILPGLGDTAHLIGEKQFSEMKDGVLLLNDGRGNVFDPAALKAALSSGKIGGLAVDVTEPEPLPADDALWDYPNVLVTPHVAGGFHLSKTLDLIVEIAGENLAAYLDGKPMKNVVNRRLGY